MSRAQEKVVVLAGDIGGTKTNLGLFRMGAKRPVLQVMKTYPSKDASNLESIVAQFLDKHQVPITSASFGIAGPVSKGQCKTTNLPWEVSEARMKRRFKWNHVRLLNDLEATALAVPLLTGREVSSLNKVRVTKKENMGLIAPGTGLGMALLIWRDGQYIPVASEGGHVDFAPTNKTEAALWAYLHQRLGHVSYERILSGPGLFIVYCWLKFTGRGSEPPWLAERINQVDPPRAISEAALVQKDPLAVKTLDLFVSILGAAAGNLALTGLTRGGIYLGGGIAPKILPKLRDEDLFMKAFLDKGRFTGLLMSIPVRVILNDKAALLGAARCAYAMIGKKPIREEREPMALRGDKPLTRSL